MKAVLLAGGFGTRMRPLTFSKPKPLLPLLNRPVTAHILDHLKEHGVTEVAITTNYLREQIEAYFGRQYRGMLLSYPVEDEPLGTAGCVKNIEGWLNDTFIVMQGDTITDIDLTDLVRRHKSRGGLATISAKRVDDPWNYGVMEVADGGLIGQFQEKPLMNECRTNLANTGIYVLEPAALDYVPERTFYDFSKDLFPTLLDRQCLFAEPTESFWVDVGRPEGYTAAKKWLMSKIETEMPDSAEFGGVLDGKAVFGRNTSIGGHTQIFGPVIVGDGVTVEKGCVIGPYTVLGSGVTVREYSVLNGAVLFEGVNMGSGEEVSNSFIAEGCSIGAGGVIQSDVMIGGNCRLEGNVSVINGSRIWPNMDISENTMVSGTLRRFVQMHEVRDDPRWSMRMVDPDEAFYFNKLEGNHVSYTGRRALSLLEFSNMLKDVEPSSVEYHMRHDVNDFSQWIERIISDQHLAGVFEDIKKESKVMGPKVLKHRLVSATKDRLNFLLGEVKQDGYV